MRLLTLAPPPFDLATGGGRTSVTSGSHGMRGEGPSAISRTQCLEHAWPSIRSGSQAENHGLIGLATGKHPVCVVGDGGSLFSIHAIWTAAKYRVPASFICFVNHEYRLLKDLWCHAMGTTIETTKFVGMDFNDPDVDLQKIAQGLGARADKISNQKAIGDALTRAFAHTGPTFLVIDREP